MKKNGFTHDSVDNLSVDWYTPPHIFDGLGVFDLDPASPVGGVSWIPALQYYTLEDDGLTSDWYGRVWLNPEVYGISFIYTDKEVLCKQKSVLNAERNYQQQQISSLKGKIDPVRGLQDVKSVQQSMTKLEKQLITPPLSHEKDFIETLNLVLRSVSPALRESLYQIFTLDCALRYEQSLALSVSRALISEREKNRLDAEKTLLKEEELLKKSCGIVSLIVAERQSVFNLEYLTTLEDKETESLNGIGVLLNGIVAKENGDIPVPTVENTQKTLHKTTTYRYTVTSVEEQPQRTLSQLVCPATAQSGTNTRTIGLPSRQTKESKNTLNPFSAEVKQRVWLNPPYGKQTPQWLAKMHTHRNGIALLFARTDCAWFHDYVAKADAILFLKGRVKFVDGLGVSGGNGAGSGSMLIAWGDENVKALAGIQNKGYFVEKGNG